MMGGRETTLRHLRRWAEEDPQRIAITEVGGSSLSYGDLHHESLRWAEALRGVGIGRGDHVAVLMSTSPIGVLAWLGLGWIRARHVGIHTALHGQTLEYQLTQSHSSAIIIGEQFLDRLITLQSQLSTLKLVVVPDASEAVPDLPWKVVTGRELFRDVTALKDSEPPERHEIAALVYTSGTTGFPKGVLMPWGLLETGTRTLIGDTTRDDVFYSYFGLFHSAGLVPFATMLRAGGRVVLRERFDLTAAWDDIGKHGCTIAVMMPAMATWLLGLPRGDNDADNPLRIVCMAPLIRATSEFAERFGVTIRTGYGSTETGNPVVSTENAGKGSGAGRIAPGYEGRLVDEYDYEVPLGKTGELVLRSEEPWALMVGYFGMPEETAEAWRNGWLHTGDIFKQDEDGNLHFVDRRRDAIRRRGEAIASAQVELIVSQHPEVVEAAAIGVPAQEGEEELKVVVIRSPGSRLAPEDLHDYLMSQMPRFMVPRYIEFVKELPKTEATLRVQKALLRKNPLNTETWDRKVRHS